MTNKKQLFAQRLWLLADLEQANSTRRSFASRAYRNAVWALDHLPTGLSHNRSELLAVPRIGSTVADLIIEFLDTGGLRRLAGLLESLPVDSARLSRLSRMTPSRLRMLKLELDVETVTDLDQAIRTGRVEQLAGVGPGTSEIWTIGLAEVDRPGLPIPRAAGLADRFRAHFSVHLPTIKFEIVGSIPRLDEWVESIEFWASSGEGLVSFLEQSALVIATFDNPLRVTTLAGEVLITTATSAKPTANASGLSAKLRGDFHVHSDWSPDGRQTLPSIVESVRALGWEYLAFTDHGRGLRFGGLDETDLLRQRDEIELLREGNPDLLLLQGAELNIDRDGSLDFPDHVLAMLDFRLAGVHSNFGLQRELQTERVIRAIEHPLLHAIAHLTGRRIGMRPPIELDLPAVFSAAAAADTALEINGHLDRLDLSAENAAIAAAAGVLFVVDSDAHGPQELTSIFNGLTILHRAGVPSDRIINTWERPRLLNWLRSKNGSNNRSTN